MSMENKVSFIFNVIAALMILIPISIVWLSGNYFDSTYSKMFISISISLILIGQIIVVYRKIRQKLNIPFTRIGGIIGLILVLIVQLL